MSSLVQDKELIKKASRGDSKSLSYLGLRAYWSYDTIPGASVNNDVELLMDAAAVCDNGKQADLTGNFYKYEYNQEKAEKFYAYGALTAVDQAVKGDADVCMNLARKYAFGQGLDQSDEKAYFWTQAAADAGSSEGATMTQNFWLSADVLPVSGEMASKQGKLPAASDEVKAIKKALVENEAMKVYQEAAEKSSSLVKKYKFTDLRKTPRAVLFNPVLSVLEKVSTVAVYTYVIAAILVFVVNFFLRYHETGFWHYVNEAYGFLVGPPLRLFLTLIGDWEYSEISTQMLMDNYCTFHSNILLSPLVFVLSGIMSAAWLALVVGAYTVLNGILFMLYRQGIKVTPVPGSVKSAACPYSDQAYQRILAANPQLAKYTPYELMAITNIAQCNRISILEACSAFEAIQEARETDRSLPLLKFEDRYSDMGLYFVLKKCMGIPYVKMEAPSFGLNSKLIRAYTKYRSGTNYHDAEQDLNEVISSDKSTPEEKSWAKYFIALMCDDKFLTYSENYRNDDQTTLERGAALRKEAAAHCVLANDADARCLAMRLWYSDCETLKLAASAIQEEALKEYFAVMASREEAEKRSLGEPQDREKWDTCETKCLAQQCKDLTQSYNDFLKKYSGAAFYSTLKEMEKELKSLKRKVDALVKKKYMYAVNLQDEVEETLKRVGEAIAAKAAASLAEARERQYKEEAINRRLRELDESMDSRERNINMFFTGNYATDSDMHISGKMSDSAFYHSDYARYQTREKLRKELEDEMYNSDH